MVYQLKAEKIEQIQRLAREGKSVREIASIVKAHKFTVNRYMMLVQHPDPVSDVPRTPTGRAKKLQYLDCGYCGAKFLDKGGEKTSDIKRGHIKRAFCTHRCAMNYRSTQRHNDRCKRCDKTRKELSIWLLEDSPYQATGVSFTHGYCPKCWGLLYQYRQDEQLVQVHELNQVLKKESRKDVRRKEYC